MHRCMFLTAFTCSNIVIFRYGTYYFKVQMKFYIDSGMCCEPSHQAFVPTLSTFCKASSSPSLLIKSFLILYLFSITRYHVHLYMSVSLFDYYLPQPI